MVVGVLLGVAALLECVYAVAGRLVRERRAADKVSIVGGNRLATHFVGNAHLARSGGLLFQPEFGAENAAEFMLHPPRVDDLNSVDRFDRGSVEITPG